MKKAKLRLNSGITLIALVLTIVVLLILAGISISAVLGKNGILDKAKEAKYLTKLKEYEERVTLIVASEKTLKITENKKERLINLVCNKLNEQEWVDKVETKEQDNELDENKIKVTTTDNFIVITEIEDDDDKSPIDTSVVINSIDVADRNVDYITIRANATDSAGNTLIYKLYLKTQNENYSDIPNVMSDEIASGEDVELKATELSLYTVYQYKIEVTDGIADVTSEEKITGTGCSGKEYNCSDAKSYICSQAVASGTRTCGGYGNPTTSYSKCSSCGGNSIVTVTFYCTGCGTGYSQNLGCKNQTCSSYSNKSATSPGTHNVTLYTCSTHNYNGTSSTHTVYTSCKHGYNTSHKYCRHNKTSLHFPN